MKNTELEQQLRQLPAPPTPSDLASRCFESIQEEPSPTVRDKSRSRLMGRLAVAAAVSVGAVLWMRSPSSNDVSHKNVSSTIAFAETESVMQKVTFFHRREWQIGFDPDGWRRGKTEWYVGRPGHSEMWFDAERGEFDRQIPRPGTEPTKQQTLFLPDGSEHFRLYNSVRITEFSSKHWETLCRGIQQSFANLAKNYHGFNYGVPAQLVSMTQGRWKEQTATVFTFSAPPSEENAAHGAPTVRCAYFVDPDTKRLMASQWFASWPSQPNRAERQVQESEYDYAQRPTASIFSPRRFSEGATKIQRQEGGPGVVLSPEPERSR